MKWRLRKNNQTSKELSREERMKREYNRLHYSYSKVSPRRKRIITPLVERAAFMLVSLEDMEKDLLENGFVEMFSQSDTQEPYERRRPTADLYNTLNKNYQSIIKQLNDAVVEPEENETHEAMKAFMKWVNEKPRAD